MTANLVVLHAMQVPGPAGNFANMEAKALRMESCSLSEAKQAAEAQACFCSSLVEHSHHLATLAIVTSHTCECMGACITHYDVLIA